MYILQVRLKKLISGEPSPKKKKNNKERAATKNSEQILRGS